MIALDEPLSVFNIDGTKNSAGDITHTAFIAVEHKGHRERVWAEVTDLGKVPLILGWTWLHKHNPDIDWKTGEVKLTCCPNECSQLKPRPRKVRLEEEREIQAIPHIYGKIKEIGAAQTSERPLEEQVPKEFHKYLSVFSKKASERMPV
ncbi:hypothetical protein BV22DRAFT_1017836 [Leucogyrophana mollusca]|uniref:Uncharacterized protein n=1 Tax=Leucogyrophana mollusca TaxID=85980 RepID=A0ACB8B913_9AGAM|nr:hypothetical protein BV22DRAFT_1017836 [Leucogyrophana mollusca]